VPLFSQHLQQHQEVRLSYLADTYGGKSLNGSEQELTLPLKNLNRLEACIDILNLESSNNNMCESLYCIEFDLRHVLPLFLCDEKKLYGS